MSIAYTKKQQVDEIIRCGKDPKYFIKKYLKISHPSRGVIPFKLYPFQEDCVEAFLEHRYNIIVKSRQLGLSTVSAGYALWLSLFHRQKNVLIVATKLATAQGFIQKVKTMLQFLPDWMLLSKFEDSRQEIRFDNGSKIRAIPTSDDAGRGEAISLLIIDEAAFIKDFDRLWTGLKPTVSTGGSCIMLSSPNGAATLFYNLYAGGLAGQNNFNAITLPYHVHPEHDEDWLREEAKDLPPDKIKQEFLCEFLTSGESYLRDEEFEFLRRNVKPPLYKQNFDRNLWIWTLPVDGHKYVIGADISRGDAKDSSAFHILDLNTGEQVAEYCGKIPPENLAELLFQVGMQYNTAILIPENNTFGYITCKRLVDMQYPKLYWSKARPNEIETYKPIDLLAEQPGFTTQKKSRTQALEKMNQCFRQRRLVTYSERLVNEFKTFVWQNDRPQALKNCQDDLVMSLAISAWLFDILCELSGVQIVTNAPITQFISVERRPSSMIHHNLFQGVRQQATVSSRTPDAQSDTRDFRWLLR